MNTNDKIKKIRELMVENSLDAYIIPSGDPHQSEYVSEHWEDRSWVSGFTGSAGTLVITKDKSGLWTDGRYYIQAERQIKDSEIKLFKYGEKDVINYDQWLYEELESESAIGFNGMVYPWVLAKGLKEKLEDKKMTINGEHDFVRKLWDNRPKQDYNEIFYHDIEFTGKSTKEKIELAREEMKKEDIDTFIISSLDDIAWLFNIRGSDISNNPVAMSYAIISKERADIFLKKEKLNKDAFEKLENNDVIINNYEDIEEFIKLIDNNSIVYIDPKKLSQKLYVSIPSTCKIKEGTNITTNLKAQKNSVEIENLKNCQLKDGVAMVNFLFWLNKNIEKETITEISATNKLEDFRKEQEHFISPSFDSIAGYKDNAAMMHYKATEENQYELKPESFFLIDSGGQYLDGTTDITRTIPLGSLTKQEKEDFTLVLKGHISLCRAKFLYGATGSDLDTLARFPLWERGIDYKCGTGHGIGYFLNVHEGPQSFSQPPNSVKIEPNMVSTVEPGIYREGLHGIRIENTVISIEDEKNEFGTFMKFETISYCPIDLDAIVPELLSKEEIDWLNDYHRDVYEKLSPRLSNEVKLWLKEKTKEI